jgi:diketogulonate reductase-like aldo/keto reductase
MHWPLIDMDQSTKEWNHRPLEEFWKDMEECVRKGYTKHIAVSNFNGQLLSDLLTFCKIKPIINQIETHPYLPQQPLV